MCPLQLCVHAQVYIYVTLCTFIFQKEFLIRILLIIKEHISRGKLVGHRK